MSASETIERLRKLDCYLAPDCSVAVPLTDLRALLDIAEAAERLRDWGGEWLDSPWWLSVDDEGRRVCLSCACPVEQHADACPAIALDRALDALGGE